MLKRNRINYLQCDFVAENLAVVTSLVEKSALAFTMLENEAMALTLATEEVFNYFINTVDSKGDLKITCSNGGYYVQVDFVFPIHNINLKALNITADIDPTDEEQFFQIGLLIAARMVDRINYYFDQSGNICLSIYKEKTYPLAKPLKAVLPDKPYNEVRIIPAEAEDLIIFCQNLLDLYERALLPTFLNYPGKFIDMIRNGEYHTALALDNQNNIWGGIIWHQQENKTAELFGPFLLASLDGIEEALHEYCLEKLGRSNSTGVINRCVFNDNYVKYYEYLGYTKFNSTEGKSISRKAVYRQLGEDLGARVLIHPDLKDYLQEEYQRLCLPRDLVFTSSMGEDKQKDSVFFATWDSNKQLTLRVLSLGEDSEENLQKYVQLFHKEGILNLFFEMDLGESWQWEITPALLGSKFLPRLIIPYGGKGDLLIFQYEQGEEL